MKIYCGNRTFGRAEIRCEVQNASIQGTIRGPFCRYSRTLPATYSLEGGNATVVDPCYWTPKLPFQYEFALRVTDDQARTNHVEFLAGIRHCLPHRNSLFLDGKRTVVRGVELPLDCVDVEELKAHHCALVVEGVTAQLALHAGESGLLIVHTGEQLAQDDLDQWTAIHFSKSAPMSDCDVLALLDTECATGNKQALGVTIVNESELTAEMSSDLPVFIRRIVHEMSVEDMRKECDGLQSDVAKFGQFAGYLVKMATP